MTPTNPPDSWLRPGLLAAVLILIIGAGVVAYLQPFANPPEIPDSTGPKPEIVAQGITTFPVYLFFGGVTIAVVLAAFARRMKRSHRAIQER